MGLKQLYASAYHPECNGTVERWNRTMSEMMKCIGTEYKLDLMGNDVRIPGDDWAAFNPMIAAAPNNK